MAHIIKAGGRVALAEGKLQSYGCRYADLFDRPPGVVITVKGADGKKDLAVTLTTDDCELIAKAYAEYLDAPA